MSDRHPDEQPTSSSPADPTRTARFRSAPDEQTQYGQAQYGQAQYGQASYGETQYGQPQYGQTQYGQPQQYEQAQYEQMQYGQTQYGQPRSDQPYYGQYQPGSVAPPPGRPYDSGSSNKLIGGIIVGICVLALVVGLGAFWLTRDGADSAAGAGAGTGGGGGEEATVSRCESAPQFRAEQVTMTGAGLTLRLQATAGCADGDVLDGNDTQIAIGDGGELVAAGLFDFGSAPLMLPPADNGSVTTELTFPDGSFLRLPETLDSSLGSLEVRTERGSAAGDATATYRPGEAGPALTATASAIDRPTGFTVDYGAALRRQVEADEVYVDQELVNRWVSQLSSKRPGLVADGRTWDDRAILEEFFAFRAKYPQARLLYSSQWPVFSQPGWWVTVGGEVFAGPEQALSWCRSEGYDRDHCFAKLISRSGGPQNSTRYLN